MRIPVEYRQRILNENIIDNARAVASNPFMRVLFEIYQAYLDPTNTDLSMGCSFCLNNILKTFNTILPDLIDLEKEYKLIHS